MDEDLETYEDHKGQHETEAESLTYSPPVNEEDALYRLLLPLEHDSGFPRPWLFCATEELVPGSIDRSLKIRLGILMASTGTSNVFRIEGKPDLIIKYQSHWSGGTFSAHQHPLWKLHPIVREFFFLSHTAPLGISPQVLTISSHALVQGDLNQKTTLQLSLDSMETFMFQQPSVRYIIMQRAGESILSFLRLEGAQTSVWALDLAIRLMEILKVLHADNNIIHGDIHHGNVVFAEPLQINPNQGVRLIDFGKAFYAQPPADCFEDVERIPVHPMHSPWMMEARYPSFRDDLYQALQVTAIAMSGPELFTAITNNANDLTWEENYLLKMSGSIFGYPGFSPLDGVPQAAKDLILGVESSVKRLSYHQLPKYGEIVEQLTEARRILSESGIPETRVNAFSLSSDSLN